MSNRSSPPVATKANVKKEQHAVSRMTRPAVRPATSGVGSRSIRSPVGAHRSSPRNDVANSSSNSATRSGRSAVGKVQACGTHATSGSSAPVLMAPR